MRNFESPLVHLAHHIDRYANLLRDEHDVLLHRASSIASLVRRHQVVLRRRDRAPRPARRLGAVDDEGRARFEDGLREHLLDFVVGAVGEDVAREGEVLGEEETRLGQVLCGGDFGAVVRAHGGGGGGGRRVGVCCAPSWRRQLTWLGRRSCSAGGLRAHVEWFRCKGILHDQSCRSCLKSQGKPLLPHRRAVIHGAKGLKRVKFLNPVPAVHVRAFSQPVSR